MSAVVDRSFAEVEFSATVVAAAVFLFAVGIGSDSINASNTANSEISRRTCK